MAVTAGALRELSTVGLPATMRRVLIVGNFLSGSGGNRGVCEDLAEKLAVYGWGVSTTSYKVGRMERLAHMLFAAWRARREYPGGPLQRARIFLGRCRL